MNCSGSRNENYFMSSVSILLTCWVWSLQVRVEIKFAEGKLETLLVFGWYLSIEKFIYNSTLLSLLSTYNLHFTVKQFQSILCQLSIENRLDWKWNFWSWWKLNCCLIEVVDVCFCLHWIIFNFSVAFDFIWNNVHAICGSAHRRRWKNCLVTQTIIR